MQHDRHDRSRRGKRHDKRPPPQHGLPISRRTALGAGAAALMAGMGFGAYRIATAHRRFLKEEVPAIRRIAERHAALAGESAAGVPQRYVGVWKMSHGGPTGVKFMRADWSRFLNFVNHHEGIFRTQVELLKRYGPENFRCLIEGAAGKSRDWPAEFKETIASLGMMNRMLAEGAADPAVMRDFLRVTFEQLEDPVRGTGVLQALNAGYRFAAYCAAEGHNRTVIGTDVPGREALSGTFLRELVALGDTREFPSDAALQGFIDRFKRLSAEDSKVRHDHMLKLLGGELRPGGAAAVIIGASHLKAGAHYPGEESFDYPLEEVLGALPETQVDVWDERNLIALLSARQSDGSEIQIESMDTLTVETLKRQVRLLREGKGKG